MASYDVKSGVTSTGIILFNSDHMNVHFGGVAVSTTLRTNPYSTESRSWLQVFSGGIASETTVSDGGHLNLPGGSAYKTTISSGGSMWVFSSGAVANITTIKCDGLVEVYSSGVANSTTISSGGKVMVSSGGVANSTTIFSGGKVMVSSGGTANKTTVYSSGLMTVYSGGSANSTTVNFSGALFVSGGKANSTTVNSGGFFFVYSGGTATEIVENGGKVVVNIGATVTFKPNTFSNLILFDSDIVEATVHSGTTAYNTTVNSNCALYVYSGGIADGVTVSTGAVLDLFSGGTATNTDLNSGGSLTIYSGGTANRLGIKSGVSMIISQGVTADSATVSSGGKLYVSSGGTANSTTVNSGGFFFVSSGGTATNIDLKSGGSLTIQSGGTASGITFSSGGIFVNGGGTANGLILKKGASAAINIGRTADSATVSAGASMVVSSGGTARAIMENGGYVYIEPGATATFAPNTFSNETVSAACSATVHSGTKANSTTIASKGSMTVYSGGKASDTKISSGGMLTISSGGIADGVTVSKGAVLNLYSGGTANRMGIKSGVSMIISQGITADSATVSSGGFMQVNTGVSVKSATVKSGGEMTIHGIATSTTVTDGAVNILGVASNTTVQGMEGFGYLYVSSGGMANSATVNSAGRLHVSSGGMANSATVNESGTMHVSQGGQATSATVNNGGRLDILNSGFADTVVLSSGWMDVSSGGRANKVFAGIRGLLTVSAGGTATGVMENGGYVDVRDGADVQFDSSLIVGLTLTGASATVHSMTSANGFTLNANGSMTVYSGGRASGTTVNTGGTFNVYSGGVASATTVSGGVFRVNPGGVACSATLIDARIQVSSGGTATGKLTFGTNGSAYFDAGGILDFDLTKTYAGGAALVNDLSVVQGTPSYTLTVSGSLPDGTYNLAEGATGFDKTITVRNTLGTELGTLTVGETQKLGGMNYTLTLTGSALSVEIDGTPDPDITKPVVSNVQASIITATNQNVTVTADFADDVAVASKLYRIGDGAWTDYADGVTVTENATVYFKAIDTSSNESEVVSYAVTNIDKIPPAKPTASADVTAPTNQNVTVTATFAGDSVKNEYSLDGTNWGPYSGGVIVDENGSVWFRSTDEAGNFSEVTEYTVGNIDKVAPTITNITHSPTAPATSVTVTAVFDDDVELSTTLYRIGDGGWFNYNLEGVTVTTNTTVYFKATDTAGNATTASYEVTNIETSEPDTTKPTVTNIAASTTALTNNNVFVTADFSDNVAVASKLYKIGDGAWTLYEDGVVVTENATVYFKAVDTSDNESDVAEYAVTNIDKVAPTITNITHSPTAPAKSVTVTATFADNIGLATKQYKIGTSGAWTDYVDGVIMTENGTVYFWAVDTAGNESSTVSHTVTNIEPTGSSITGDITGETKDVPAGWTALNVNVNTGGKLNVLDGGVASNTNVNAGGRLYVSSGGIARDTTVNDGGLIEGSGCEIDGIVVNSGGSLLLYSGAKLTGQMTFASGAEVIPFVGSILDFDLTQTEPGSPALVNDLSILMGTPTYTITVDNAQALGTYKLAGGAAGFDKPITVRSIYGEIGCTLTVDGGATKLGDVYLTLALSGSDLTFTISEDSGGGIIPDNKPDDGTNDYLWKKGKDFGWNDASIHVTNEITGNGEVLLDMPGTIDTEDGWHNLFGHDKDNMDTGDVAQVEVNDPAKLTFTIDSNAAGTFYVYEDGFDKKGNRKMITVKKVTVKAGKLATLKDVCLTSTGKYYVAMTAKNVKKVGTEGLYNVNVIESKFFVDADEGTNNTAKDYWQIGIGRGSESKLIILDGSSMKGSTEFKNFVGFTDGKDYAKLDLTDSAYLKFHVTGNGDGKAKFTIWKQTKGTTGKLSKVTGVSLPAKKVYDATTKAQFLDTSKYTYYVSMECSDEAKGKSVYYNVQITDDAVFFDSDDDGRNDVLYDKKAKSFYMEDANHHFETTTIGTGTHVKLDSDPVADTDWENFVGYQDATDYAKIKLTGNGNLSFHIEATGDATFTVYRKGEDKKGNETLEAIQTAKLAVASGASKTEKDIQISDLEAGEYYVSMAAKSTKANDKGSVFYNVTATLDVPLTSALAMPETDALAGASLDSCLDSASDKLFGETNTGLLA